MSTTCPFCNHALNNPEFHHGVWDKLRFGDPIDVTEEQWVEETLSHEPDCPWLTHRGDCFWTA